MAFSTGGGSSRRIAQTSIAEINVTPLVDVMLVLLVIFMAASAVESARLSREAETLRQVATDDTNSDAAAVTENQVPVDLPKAKADKVNKRASNATPTLTFDGRTRIWLGKRQLVDCRKHPGAFEACLDAFEKALQTTASAEQLRQVQLRADKNNSYGQVLAVMARMRRAGITHFGLITEAPAAGG